MFVLLAFGGTLAVTQNLHAWCPKNALKAPSSSASSAGLAFDPGRELGELESRLGTKLGALEKKSNFARTFGFGCQ